jgi:predicted transcriptional regulator
MEVSASEDINMAKSSLEPQNLPETKGRQEKRDKLDLIIELLTASGEPVKKTHLLYRTHINHAQLTRYLSFVLRIGMMKETSDPFEGYVITEKGRLMLELFAEQEPNLKSLAEARFSMIGK